jgi:hypothetical protein
MAETLAMLRPDEVPEVLRALDLFERAGSMDAVTDARWREAVRFRAAELAEPHEA